MSRRRRANQRPTQTSGSEKQPPIIPLIGAIIGAVGLIIVAFINRSTPFIPIQATQTAEMLHTLVALTTNTWEALNTSVAMTIQAQLSLSAPTFTETLFPSFTPEPAQTEIASPTSTLTPTQPPIIVITTQPPIVDTPCNARVTFDEPIYFSDQPRIDVTFSAICVLATYRPMVVVQDYLGHWYAWTHIDGAGSGTYRLPGITIGTKPEDCGEDFTVYMIMTLENIAEGEIQQFPAGPNAQTTVRRHCQF